MITRSETAITQFASVLYNPSDIVEVRLIPAPYKTDLKPFSKWCHASELETLAQKLAEANDAGYGIYAGANPRRARGERGDKSIVLARVVFIDYDKTDAENADLRRDSAGLPIPTLVVASGHGVHHYWRLSEPITDMARWREIQKSLAKLVDGDTACQNPERIMRIPGFINNKVEAHARSL